MGEASKQVTIPGRDAAWELVCEWVQAPGLRAHLRACEAGMRAYAREFGEDEELWGCTGLLHDFDWERHPTAEQHPAEGAPVLREHGWPEVVVRAVLSHADHAGVERTTQMEHALYACDELSGFLLAVARVRPQGFEGLSVKSVRKKLKQPSFAAGVDREDVQRGADELGVELAAHIQRMIDAIAPIGDELLER